VRRRFADAALEDDGVQTAEHDDERPGMLAELIDEEFDRFSATPIV
jgi:hypothetical protein